MSLEALEAEVVECRRCPRLVAWREEVAQVKRRSFAHEEYWARPTPSFGDLGASIVIVGLAPAAHGGNRTGRIFTGDRSGDFLFAGLHRAGFANQPTSVRRGDGLAVRGMWILAAVKCAPPANRPTPEERDTCADWARRELALLPNARVLLTLGGFAWDAALRLIGDTTRPKPKFAHLAEHRSADLTLLGCFHPSQQNTFTGRFTPPMLDEALARAKVLAEEAPEQR